MGSSVIVRLSLREGVLVELLLPKDRMRSEHGTVTLLLTYDMRRLLR